MGQNSYEPQNHVYGKYKTHVKQVKIQEKMLNIKLNRIFDKFDLYRYLGTSIQKHKQCLQ